MKQSLMVLLLLGLVGISGSARAHDEAQGPQTITGEVVDLACYLGHGASGSGHAACAQKCIASGLPVGIKTKDTLYIAVADGHGTANSQLASLASKQVTVEGDVTERDEVHMITIKKVKVTG